jgi:DNA-binding HxlR family transcriptional regulator
MTVTEEHVPVAENSNAIALGLLGDEWNLTIVKLAIMSGVRRYKEFRDSLGIANSVLTVRLRRLTDAGVFTAAGHVPQGLRGGVLPGHALPGLQTAGRHP